MEEKVLKELRFVAYGIGAIIIVLIINKSFNAVGELLTALNPFAEDVSDKELKAKITDTEKRGYFNPSFIKNSPAGTALLTKKGAEVKARNIWDSVNFVYDEPARIKAQFSDIITKSQVSHLAKVFKEKFNKDLLEFLFDHMDKDDQQLMLKNLLETLDALPDFTSPKQPKTVPIAKPYTPKPILKVSNSPLKSNIVPSITPEKRIQSIIKPF
jgi:hypothetical protein